MRIDKEDRGQILIILAILLPVLILFVGLAIDGGMAYITKAKLSKAVDAACLTGMKNLPQGQPTATTLATHIFNANFGANPPTPAITFPKDSYGDQQVSVTATAQVPTFFAQRLFQFWNVSDTATATRGKLLMGLILDRSGSMASDGGSSALKAAVPLFVDDFDNTLDEVTMVSFASNATVDFAINTGFQTPISNAVKALNPSGGTFGTGGTYVATDGPPLTLADNQITSVPIQSGQNITRVVVYFTDGLMNTIQDSFTCYTSATTTVTPLLNYGGWDSGTTVDVFNPVDGTDWCPGGSGNCIYNGTTKSYNAIAYDSKGDFCQNPWKTVQSTFISQQYGSETINRANVTAEAQYRALQTAAAMRAETPGTYIYTIGLGSGVTTSTQTFLRELANDPASPTYNASLPQGLFLYVPDCPSSTCTSELNTAFQTIASKILLRLTQ